MGNEPALNRTSEALTVARTLLRELEKGNKVSRTLRIAERLADLTSDPFMMNYSQRALEPARQGSELRADLTYCAHNRDAGAAGIYRYLEDFQGEGTPIGVQLKALGTISYTMGAVSVPEAENFVASARRRVKYTAADADFLRSVETNEAILERVKNRLYRYATRQVSVLLFESVPEGVIERTREKVDSALAKVSPGSLEKFAVAYEELTGKSAENWTNACLAVRRILLDFADAVYPARDESVDGRAVGTEQYVNRLWAHAKQKIASDSQRSAFVAELTDLGARIDAIYAQSSKGVHATVTKDEAERIIVRAYLVLADLI